MGMFSDWGTKWCSVREGEDADTKMGGVNMYVRVLFGIHQSGLAQVRTVKNFEYEAQKIGIGYQGRTRFVGGGV